MPITGSRIVVTPFEFANFTATPIFNKCMLSYFNGLLTVPLHLTKLDSQTTNAKIQEVNTGPMLHIGSGTAAGGSSIGYGINELPKVVMEGWIDTPLVSRTNPTPNFTLNGSPPFVINMYYGELIAACFDGRINVNANTDWWVRQDPDWFRDPYGRVYNTPRVIAFTAARIEAVPGRENFQMTLLVGMNS